MYSGENTADKLKNLLLFDTSGESAALSTLQEYKLRMAESQSKIFYATGKDRASIENLPQMELLRDKGIEVLYLFDAVDEFAIEALGEYEGKRFQSISRGDLELDDVEAKEDKKKAETVAKSNEELIRDIKEVLGAKVSDVQVSAA